MRVKAFAGRQALFCHLKAQTSRSFGQFIAAKLFFHRCSSELRSNLLNIFSKILIPFSSFILSQSQKSNLFF